MLDLYTKPLRVYIILAALALWGILSASQLPISLFPKSSQVTVAADIPYGSFSSQQYFESYGRDLEGQLQGLKINSDSLTGKISVKTLKAEYRNHNAHYTIQFEWGADADQAIKEVNNKVQTVMSAADDGVRQGISVRSWRENQGFYALSFYSPMRSLDEIYSILNSLITPISAKITDAEGVGLYNPNKKEISIIVSPEKLAQYEITTLTVHRAVQEAVTSLNGGTLKMGDKEYQLNLPRSASTVEELQNIRLTSIDKSPIFLKDLAEIKLAQTEASRQKFKTNGVESIILFADPKEGGNIKNMADQITAELSKIEHQWPQDIQYKVLVNPSDFINNSVLGVLREVLIAALLAVIVLFIFIGSLKNVATAAIEIPLSLIMAFILMRLTGMNLNMISLGGLALSAGMNVDASVVVLENIFRHFELHKQNNILSLNKNLQSNKTSSYSLSYADKCQIVLTAVNEVKLPIIASTIASLVVFAPLVFTNGLTNSLLGDLAKAVIFSHGLSAIVALILVPTIRLHILKNSTFQEVHSPFEKYLKKIENGYSSALQKFLMSTNLQRLSFLAFVLTLPALIYFVVPRLNKEVIGRPDSDWLIVGVYSPLFNTSKQLEAELDILEQEIMAQEGDKIQYTFMQIQGERNGFVMIRLKDKKDIANMITRSEDRFKNTATKFYFVEQWNPSELEIPDPPQLRLEVSGGSPEKQLQIAQDIQNMIIENDLYDKTRVIPSAEAPKGLTVRDPVGVGSQQSVLSKNEISHSLRTATDGIYLSRLQQDNQDISVYLRFPKSLNASLETLKSIPIGFEGKVLPLGAIANINIESQAPTIYRENQNNMIVLTSTLNKSHKELAPIRLKQLRSDLNQLQSEWIKNPENAKTVLPSVIEAVPDKELIEALDQLKWAIAISIALIFLTMVIQLGDLIQAALVLVAIPLGLLGVILSLWLFRSSLSLNSGLGTILLNGIAVANSIILVDFIQKLYSSGHSPLLATVTAATARLRPILMTSLTTVLGMLPIAFGLGEGGKILQPLGIAVCGGLWISMSLTLFFVPALQFQYLNRRQKNQSQQKHQTPSILPQVDA